MGAGNIESESNRLIEPRFKRSFVLSPIVSLPFPVTGNFRYNS
jgi:hypothetical protein